jgi:hypothetical protein
MENLHRLDTLDDVRQRMLLPGPHATLVIQINLPGTPGDDRTIRWHAARAELRHAGGDDTAIAWIEAALDVIEHRRMMALVTANRDSAAYCWLTGRARAGLTDTVTSVGKLPSLAPAFAELRDRVDVVGAVADRVGADIYVFDRLDLVYLASVEGDDEFVHRAAPGGWAQPRYQRRAELTWDRNAEQDAEQLAAQADHVGTSIVALTGDERATALITEHLLDGGRFAVHRFPAGGRHEPDTPHRLHGFVVELTEADRQHRVQRALDDLSERLARHDRAVTGPATRQALADHQVGTLFVGEPAAVAGLDDLLLAAIAGGADVIVVDRLRVSDHHPLSDHLAALLRATQGDGSASANRQPAGSTAR